MAGLQQQDSPGLSHGSAASQSYDEAIAAAERVLQAAKVSVKAKVDAANDPDAPQQAMHGYAWLATYVEALRQLRGWAQRLGEEGRAGEIEQLILAVGFAEYLAQIAGGIPMSQGEIVRLGQLGVPADEVERFQRATADLVSVGSDEALRARLAALIAERPEATTFGDPGMDETHTAMREEMRKFAADKVLPDAHEWHLSNSYIPLDVITQMSEMGVFGLTIPESFGGMGLGKEAMCVVSEELSRGTKAVPCRGTG
jgi:(2S)-methylsuccinyl-CoA dehydrogenase